MTDSKRKYLVIDLQKCDQCESCTISCDFHGRPETKDHGISGLRERATFALICRRCSNASCINACVFDALERGPGGVIERHNLRCVSCKMCAHACPFGTIFPDMLSFYSVSCDLCLDQGDSQPACVTSCHRDALAFRLMDPSETDVHVIDQHMAARAKRWVRKEITA